MKARLTIFALLLAGCASTQTARVDRSDQSLVSSPPQTSLAGEGSLMPGAYESRAMETGQFTGQERTNDKVGQRPALPPYAGTRDSLQEAQNETGKGAGTLGQTGVVPDEPVTGKTLLEDTSTPD